MVSSWPTIDLSEDNLSFKYDKQEETIENWCSFYSLKESDIKDIDTFLEVGMPYTEIEKNGHYDEVEKAFLSGQTVMIIDGFDECILIDCRTLSDAFSYRALQRQGFAWLKRRICRDACVQCSTFKKKNKG